MAVFVSNIVIEQGFDFETTFELEDSNTNLPLNLSGYTINSQIRKTYSSSAFTVVNTNIVGDSTNGIISISLASTITEGIKPGRYVYDVKLTSPGETSITKAVEGSAIVRGGVTR